MALMIQLSHFNFFTLERFQNHTHTHTHTHTYTYVHTYTRETLKRH
jgi:hypothetical protein